MTYFTQDFIAFFRKLARNNRREWYHANKAIYEAVAKRPFETLVEELIHRLGALDPRFQGVSPGDCIFRLARDTRFSRDKTPYKTHAAAVIAPGGRKHRGPAGVYVQASAEGLGIAGGLYDVDKEALYAVRQAIRDDGESLERLLRAHAFKRLFGGRLEGERNKRVPPEFADAARRHPLIYHRQFYYWTQYDDPEIVLRDELADFVVRHWKAGRAINAWLAKALLRRRGW